MKPLYPFQWIETLTDPAFADGIREKIQDNVTFSDIEYYDPAFDIKTDSGTSHVSVVAPDGGAVGITTTLNLQ